MAWRRRTRKFNRRRFIRRRKPTIKRIVRRQISKMIETKKQLYYFNEVALTSASTYPGAYKDGGMSITQGTNMCQRMGNWVNGVGFKTRWLLHNNAANDQFVRYLLLINKQGSSNLDYATGASLFDNNSGVNTDLSTFTNNAYLVRRINMDKYTVLCDKIIRLGGVLDKDKIFSFKKYVPLRLRKYNYDSTTAVLPTKGNIVEIWLTAEADDDAVGETVELTGEQTFFFKDA